MGIVDQSLVFWDLAVEVAKRNGVDEVFGHCKAEIQTVVLHVHTSGTAGNYRQGSEN